jgi:hypothetical protein
MWTSHIGKSYESPPISENEVEAKRHHNEQMQRLKLALESRKRIEGSVDKISQEFEKA